MSAFETQEMLSNFLTEFFHILELLEAQLMQLLSIRLNEPQRICVPVSISGWELEA